jgi:excisionase family DNA binding protein
MKTNRTELLLPVKEAAALVRQHPNTVRRAIREGRLSAVRLGPGGQLRVPRRALDAFLEPVSKRHP